MLSEGFTMMHEHVTIDLSGVKKDLDCRLDTKEETIEEFKALKAHGVGNVLEVTNIGMGRNVRYIKDVAEASGINILVSTGFYKEPFLPGFVYTDPEEKIVELLVSEIEEGIEDTGVKASVIGEFGTSKNVMTEMEEKVFRICSEAALRTGRPVTTHTTLGTMGYEQADYLIRRGIDPDKIVIGHQDLSQDLGKILSVLSLGVNVGFDTVGKNNYSPDSFRADALKEIFSRGLGDHVILSMDITRKSHLKGRGGLGYSYLFTSFLPLLRSSGFGDEEINTMLVTTPKRILEGK